MRNQFLRYGGAVETTAGCTCHGQSARVPNVETKAPLTAEKEGPVLIVGAPSRKSLLETPSIGACDRAVLDFERVAEVEESRVGARRELE